VNDLPDIDPAIYARLATADVLETVDLLGGLVAMLPVAYQPALEDRVSIYRDFASSRKFMKMPPDHPMALTLKGWILRDWADQARQIKEQIEAALTRV
jgi:hypothetical protein